MRLLVQCHGEYVTKLWPGQVARARCDGTVKGIDGGCGASSVSVRMEEGNQGLNTAGGMG